MGISCINRISVTSKMNLLSNEIKRLRVLDIPVDVIDMDTALKAIDTYISSTLHPGYIAAVNPEKVYAARKDPSLKKFLEYATILIPDGIGIVMAVRFIFGTKIKRVTGADLMKNICALSSKKGYRIFIYGAKEEVNKIAVEKLKLVYPDINIVGRANGYQNPEEMKDLIERINNSNTDILFVGLGSPSQEKWIQENLPRLTMKLCQGIGGTLDTIAGNIKRAPQYIQRLNIEWLYRLVHEPHRWRRQIILPLFVLEVIFQKISRKIKRANSNSEKS